METMSRRKRGHFRRSSAVGNLGFQIAPMIDVVFVILLFFIVQASDMPVENYHLNKLPSAIQAGPVTGFLDEVAVRVADDGQVYLNEDPVDGTSDGTSYRGLPELAGNLGQIKQSSDASGSPVLITIYANELAKYQRVVDILDVLAQVGISTVTFDAGTYD